MALIALGLVWVYGV